MEALIEFLPLLAFLIAYKWHGIYAATACLMGAMALLLVYDRLRHQRIPPMHLASAALVFVLGGARYGCATSASSSGNPRHFSGRSHSLAS